MLNIHQENKNDHDETFNSVADIREVTIKHQRQLVHYFHKKFIDESEFGIVDFNMIR